MINEETRRILETFISMSAQKDSDVLTENILNDALFITNCDAGTLYIVNEGKLEFRVMITKSQNINRGGKNERITLPPVQMSRHNVCAYSVLEKKSVNIADVYSSELFDFSGPKNYDKLTNYRTKSMMVIPMENDKGTIIGVLQLMNALDGDGNIISFSKKNEMILTAIASQAAIKLTNINYTLEIKGLMESIVRTFAEVIYQRTPYNVSHTHNMHKYASRFMQWLSDNPHDRLSFTEEGMQLFYMSIWLHDIGKLITPLEIMDKETRLSTKYERVMARLDIITLTAKLNALRQGVDCSETLSQIEKVRSFIGEVNVKPFLDNETLAKVKELVHLTYIDDSGQSKPWFTDDEIEDLSIIKGTLTPKERAVMQQHVVMTERILAKMDFKNEYSVVPIWASNHHEFLDGSGYPKQLTSENLDTETRLLTIIDVFDGLSATDRPYKKATPIDKVFSIMGDMVDEGKLDGYILSIFKKSEVWTWQD